ncbi:hypothetical protein ACQ4PT_066628 [Festuca glaucescens]
MVTDHGEEEVIEVRQPEEVDFAVEWRTPLAVSTITVRGSEHVSAVPVARRDDFPYVVAVANDAAVFLLRARPLHVDDGLAYLLCNAGTGVATLVPSEVAHRLLRAGNIGLAGSGHLVVELQPLPGGAAVLLERFYVWSNTAYEEHPVALVYPGGDRPWGSHGVVAHGRLLFFVDLVQGLLICDPLAETPELRFVRLPEGSATAAAAHADDVGISKRRCVSVSEGMLLYVQLDEHGEGVVIRTWTLKMDGAPQWEPKSEVQSQSSLFRSAVLALVHPRKPDVLCLGVISGVCSWLVAFDLHTQRIVQTEPLALPGVPTGMLSLVEKNRY